jgi:hypothetical protein
VKVSGTGDGHEGDANQDASKDGIHKGEQGPIKCISKALVLKKRQNADVVTYLDEGVITPCIPPAFNPIDVTC